MLVKVPRVPVGLVRVQQSSHRSNAGNDLQVSSRQELRHSHPHEVRPHLAVLSIRTAPPVVSRLEQKVCIEDMILDDNSSPPTGFSSHKMFSEVILTWDGKAESIEYMAGVVRDKPTHPQVAEFRNILEYYR